MQLEEKDAAYLWDMLDTAKTIGDFIHGVRYLQYLEDR
jgi:uncharacterized protein with HEPN domain